jgi:hypothetical protein
VDSQPPSEIVDVDSPGRSPPAARGSGLPQCAQKRAPSGFGRPHWLQWTLGIASPGLPSIGHAVGPGLTLAWLARGV